MGYHIIRIKPGKFMDINGVIISNNSGVTLHLAKPDYGALVVIGDIPRKRSVEESAMKADSYKGWFKRQKK